VTPIGEPFQARALTPITNYKSFHRLQLDFGKEYHRTHLSIRQRARQKVSSRAASTTDGDEGVRTPDPLLAKQVLSQLSYIPGWDQCFKDRKCAYLDSNQGPQLYQSCALAN
jgi:hypothetical protein